MKEKTKLFVFALQLRGETREIIGVKVKAAGDYFVFMPYSRLSTIPVDVHISKHQSGERHLAFRAQGSKVKYIGIAQLQPTLSFKGVEIVCQVSLLMGQFIDLPLIGSNKGDVVLLNGDKAGFRNDFTSIQVFIAEPNKDGLISAPPNRGPHIRHVERSIVPWIVVEAFQERENDMTCQNSVCRKDDLT